MAARTRAENEERSWKNVKRKRRRKGIKKSTTPPHRSSLARGRRKSGRSDGGRWGAGVKGKGGHEGFIYLNKCRRSRGTRGSRAGGAEWSTGSVGKFDRPPMRPPNPRSTRSAPLAAATRPQRHAPTSGCDPAAMPR